MTPPEGYRSDIGQLYGDRGGGLSYGWDCDLSADVHDRYSSSTRESSIILLDRQSTCPGAHEWKIAVPNGSYRVTVGYSDPVFGHQQQRIGCTLQVCVCVCVCVRARAYVCRPFPSRAHFITPN